MEGMPDNPEGLDNSQPLQETLTKTPQINEVIPNQSGTNTPGSREDQHTADKDEGLSFNEVTRAERQQIQDTIAEMFSNLDQLPANLQEAQLSQYRAMAQDLLLASIGQHLFRDKNPDPYTGEFGLLLQSKVMDTEYRKHMSNTNMSEVLKDVLNRAFPQDRNRNLDTILEMADKVDPAIQGEQPVIDSNVGSEQSNDSPNPSQQQGQTS